MRFPYDMHLLIIALNWFTTFPIPKSRHVTIGSNFFDGLAGFRVSYAQNQLKIEILALV
jgi:hypothetical protein